MKDEWFKLNMYFVWSHGCDDNVIVILAKELWWIILVFYVVAELRQISHTKFHQWGRVLPVALLPKLSPVRLTKVSWKNSTTTNKRRANERTEDDLPIWSSDHRLHWIGICLCVFDERDEVHDSQRYTKRSKIRLLTSLWIVRQWKKT